jgi:hypothetical protein
MATSLAAVSVPNAKRTATTGRVPELVVTPDQLRLEASGRLVTSPARHRGRSMMAPARGTVAGCGCSRGADSSDDGP